MFQFGSREVFTLLEALEILKDYYHSLPLIYFVFFKENICSSFNHSKYEIIVTYTCAMLLMLHSNVAFILTTMIQMCYL